MPDESTTPDLAELSARAIESAARRDFDEDMSFYGPHSVWDLSPAGLGTYRGVAATRNFLEDWMSAYDEYEVEIQENLALGNGVTITLVRLSGRPLGSSARVQLNFASVTD